MYSKLIRSKQFSWGGQALAAEFPAHGSVSIVGSVAGGVRLAGSEEFAKVHADMLLEGTKKHDKKAIQILLDSIGASLSFSANNERLMFSARVRAENLEKLLSLISETLQEPTFPARELQVLKQRERASLSLEAQDTRAQAGIALSRLLFKKGHPNFDDTTEESQKTLGGITSKKLRAYHAASIDGGSLILSIAGDIKAPRVFTLAEKHFKKLPRQKVLFPPYEKGSVQKSRQTVARIEHKAGIDYCVGIATGITKNHSDYAPLLLGIHVLGNPGFTGRLMKTVREKEGLTYVAYSYMSGFENNADGSAFVWATFAPTLFKKGRASTRREIHAIATKGATAKEVRKHREQYEAYFRVRLSNSSAIAGAAHAVVAEGHPLSYLDTFPKKVSKLTAREVNRALKKYLVPSKLSEAAAGPVEKNALKA